jgi:hypothetical protein
VLVRRALGGGDSMPTQCKHVRLNEQQQQQGRLQRQRRLLLLLNVVGALAHLCAVAVELGRGMRLDMKLELQYEAVVFVRADNGTGGFLYERRHDGFARVAWIALGVHAVSIGFHLLVVCALALATALEAYYSSHYDSWYERGIQACRSPARWAEYFVSSTMMVYLIGVLVGVRLSSTLWPICALNATTMLFGWNTEVLSSSLVERQPLGERPWRWRPGSRVDRLVYAHLLGYVPFVAMLYFLLASYLPHRAALGEDCPDFADPIVFGTLAVFSLFGCVQLAQQAHDLGPSWYVYGEATYVALSFLAKAWLVLVANEQVLREGARFDAVLGARFD